MINPGDVWHEIEDAESDVDDKLMTFILVQRHITKSGYPAWDVFHIGEWCNGSFGWLFESEIERSCVRVA